jgi:GcrA cell cycle regulator
MPVFHAAKPPARFGVTRNAVIGKMNRLGLSRPKDGRKACASKDCKALAPKASALNTTAHHAVAAFPRPKSRAEAIPIYDGRGCTLLELSQMRCRWPISSPGVKDFLACQGW